MRLVIVGGGRKHPHQDHVTTTDTYVSLAERTAIANKAGADLFASLHRNSYSNPTAKGTEIWAYTTAGAVDEAAAGAVLEQLAAVGIQSNRGVKERQLSRVAGKQDDLHACGVGLYLQHQGQRTVRQEL